MINFIYNWGKGNKENCWSGIPYGLYNAFIQKTKVNNISLEDKFFEKCIKKSNNLINKYTKSSDFNLYNQLLDEKKLKKMRIQSNVPCFTFLELNTSATKNTYCYQDCSVDYCLNLWDKNSNLKTYSPLKLKMRKFERRLRLKKANKFYKDCKGIFTMSKWLADDLINNSNVDKNKVHYVGAGCNININLIDDKNKKGNKFLFVGKEWERKNGPLVVEAFKKLKSKHKDVELYIAGPIEQPTETKNIDGINFIGRKSYNELVQYYNICDYFVMPSKFEAFGIVFVEALIFGLPCIGRNAFAMPDIIKNDINGYILNEEDSKELCNLMELLIKNNNKISSYVKTKRNEYIKEYSWDSVADRIIDIMRKDGYDI